MLTLASTRTDIASYVSALFWVYTLLIFIYLLVNMMFSLGVRPPYSRWSDAILSFLRDVSEPYLRLFRRFIPPLGMFDFSPIVALLVLVLVGGEIANLIHG